MLRMSSSTSSTFLPARLAALRMPAKSAAGLMLSSVRSSATTGSAGELRSPRCALPACGRDVRDPSKESSGFLDSGFFLCLCVSVANKDILPCPDSGARSGRYRTNVLPLPGSLLTRCNSPPSSHASSREMDSPRPVPPYFLVVPVSA